MRKPVSKLAAMLGCAVLPLGCVGVIGANDQEDGDLEPPNGSALCTDLDVSPAPLRRLSRAEYLATVRDLFPGLPLDVTIGRDPMDHGFENRAELLNPLPLLIEQYQTAASEIAAHLIEDPGSILPCAPTPDTEAECGSDFVASMGARIFRRPLTADEKSRFTSFFDAERVAGSDFHGAVQLTLEIMLQAPQFLYRIELGEPQLAPSEHARLTPYEVATRMSYLLWGSAPDETLAEKALADQLGSADEREAEARRMLADPRAGNMFVEFHRQWLDWDKLESEPKAPDVYPDYDSSLQSAIREESDRFVASVMWKGDGTLRSLLTSPTTEVNATLAELYGAPAPASGWGETDLNPDERSGILTRANFLASQAHKIAGSPPLRAIFVLERFLCTTPPSPPPDADLSEPASKPSDAPQTNREAFEQRLEPGECAGCHDAFTDLGYAFENFDAIGRHRSLDNDLPVDATGQFSSGDIEWQLTGAIDLSEKLADSIEVEACVAKHWFEYAHGRATQSADDCRVDAFGDALAAAGGDVREALVELVKREDFVVRPPLEP